MRAYLKQEQSITAAPVVAMVIRSNFVESCHRGTVLGISQNGSPVFRRGPTDKPIFPRSANKPLQTTAMVHCGLPLVGEQLALAASSHSGEAFHIQGVRSILAQAGLSESFLKCPPATPTDPVAACDLMARKEQPQRIYMNCSGKHAAMLLTCKINDWPTRNYCDLTHPIQQAIQNVVEDLAREKVRVKGVDGCGAPIFSLTPSGLACAFRALVRSEPGSPERSVADAIRSYPAWTSATSSRDRSLMTSLPGLLAKSGAEGVLAFAHPSGYAGVLKVEDGADRPLGVLAVALLRELGIKVSSVAGLERLPVTGADAVVGEVIPTL